jgi:hypothetical protein
VTPSGFLVAELGVEGIQPMEHLLFYAKYCAWRHTEGAAHFLNGWLSYVSSQPVGLACRDLRMIPFLTALLLKGLAKTNSGNVDLNFRRLIKQLAACASELQGMEKLPGPAHDLAARMNLYVSGLITDILLLRPDSLVRPLVSRRLTTTFNARDQLNDRMSLVNLIQMLLTPRTLEVLASSSGKRLLSTLFQKIQDNFEDFQQTSDTARQILGSLRYFSGERFTKIVNGLRPFVDIVGKRSEVVRSCAKPDLLVWTLTLCLIILLNMPLDEGSLGSLLCATLILEVAHRTSGDTWARFAFTVQVIVVRAIKRINSRAPNSRRRSPPFWSKRRSNALRLSAARQRGGHRPPRQSHCAESGRVERHRPAHTHRR